MTEEPNKCALCDRPLGKKVEKHHLVPKSQGGRLMVPLHPICHRKIHKSFDEKTLARSYATIEALQAQPDIAAFIKWVANKPPDFYRRTETAASKGRRRR